MAIREAVLELLAESGYDRLTIDAVAARARAGKTTIYRRWAGKPELVVDALGCRTVHDPVPDTGSLRGDLYVMTRRATSRNSQFDGQLMLGVVSALGRDAELRTVFRENFFAGKLDLFREIFERAVRRGEVATDRDIDLLASLIPALMLQYLLVHGELPEPTFAKQVVDEIILPLALTTTTATPTGVAGNAGDAYVDHEDDLVRRSPLEEL
ncbi:MAG: TetR/AcrR family transcriptional regulator [Acidimicrobiales bacterium]